MCPCGHQPPGCSDCGLDLVSNGNEACRSCGTAGFEPDTERCQCIEPLVPCIDCANLQADFDNGKKLSPNDHQCLAACDARESNEIAWIIGILSVLLTFLSIVVALQCCLRCRSEDREEDWVPRVDIQDLTAWSLDTRRGFVVGKPLGKEEQDHFLEAPPQRAMMEGSPKLFWIKYQHSPYWLFHGNGINNVSQLVSRHCTQLEPLEESAALDFIELITSRRPATLDPTDAVVLPVNTNGEELTRDGVGVRLKNMEERRRWERNREKRKPYCKLMGAFSRGVVTCGGSLQCCARRAVSDPPRTRV